MKTVKTIRRSFFVGATLCGLGGCNVASHEKNTGGAAFDAATSNAGAPSRCTKGFGVVSSDYKSTDVSILSSTGEVLSASIVSSGSKAPGVSSALSGDVVLPSSRPPSGRLVLIDQLAAVLTWMDPTTAIVLHQLPVGTGFAANPQDYLEVSTNKAYVSRLAANPTPGREPNDAGNDVLIIDPSAFSVTGRIDVTSKDDGAYLPSAGRLAKVGDRVWVLLERFDASFKPNDASRVAGIDPDTDTVVWKLDVANAANCGGLALSPSGKLAALTCSGNLGAPTATAGRAIVLLDATTSPPTELRRFDTAVATLGRPPSPSVAFASDTELWNVAYGNIDAGRDDVLFALDVTTGTTRTIARGGAAFVLGDLKCAPSCTGTCLLTDANVKAVRQWKLGADGAVEGPPIPVDPAIGLPPVGLGEL